MFDEFAIEPNGPEGRRRTRASVKDTSITFYTWQKIADEIST